MKSFNTQTVTKPSFTKSKAYGLCGTLAIATALVFGATVSADETTQPATDTQPAVANVYTADNAGNITVTPSETVAPVAETPVFTPPAPVESQPIAETPAAPTTVTKEGTEITVSNPEVEVTFPNGTGKYSPFEVEYVVGKATADATTNKVTTVFNDYFKSHPLDKIMNLKLDASWTDKVVSGKPVNINFNGTVVTVNVGSEQVIGNDELIAKWGFQDKEDPTVINWTARVNYAKRVLNYVTIIDEMSENQKLVDNYFEINSIESLDPWVDKGSAMDLVKSISKSEHGFEIKMDRLDRMVYLYYKTKLVNAVKDSTNPTNKIELKAESDGAVSYTKIQLVGGRGDASGENKPEPTFEVPHDAPKYEKPKFEGGIPGIPEVRELPEWNGGTVPNEAPVYDKPEWNGGIPGIPEVRELPPFKGGVVPNDAPILDLPELEIPVEPEKPSTPKEVPSKPVEVPKEKVAQPATVSYNFAPASKETPKTTVYGGTLPNTGEKEGIASTLGLVVIAAGIASLTLSFKKYNGKEDK